MFEFKLSASMAFPERFRLHSRMLLLVRSIQSLVDIEFESERMVQAEYEWTVNVKHDSQRQLKFPW